MKCPSRPGGINKHALETLARAALRLAAVTALAIAVQLPMFATPPPSGVVPIISPSGGFAIDGDLQANTPVANGGDWVGSTNAGNGGFVLNQAGAPVNSSITFHFVDPYDSSAD